MIKTTRLWGADIKVSGDLTIKEDYYPWISEDFIGGNVKSVNLLRKGYAPYLKCQALQARSVDFEPVLHSNFVAYSKGPKVKGVGSYTTYLYPDGTRFTGVRMGPDFNKLEAIRKAAESKK